MAARLTWPQYALHFHTNISYLRVWPLFILGSEFTLAIGLENLWAVTGICKTYSANL